MGPPVQQGLGVVMAAPCPGTREGRLAGLIAVVLLHAGFVYALVSGVGRQAIELRPPTVEARIVTEVKAKPPELAPPPPLPVEHPPPPPPPTKPQHVRQSPQVRHAAAPVAVTPAPAPAPAAVPAPSAAPVALPAAPVAAPPEQVRAPPVIDAARSCRPPQYPAASRQKGEAGTVLLTFLIDVDGQVIDSRVEGSSGFERLDQAARDALALCRFTPGTLDGQPVRAWARMKYVWKLN